MKLNHSSNKKNKNRFVKTFEDVFIHSWWVILFIFCCYLGYDRGLKKRDDDYNKLYTKFILLQQENKAVIALRENLLLQINSQSDPDFVELTLMKGLGLVSEGQIKVVFSEETKK